jgi:hypothetical protein
MKTAEEVAREVFLCAVNMYKTTDDMADIIRADREALLKEAQDHIIAALLEEFGIGRELLKDLARERLERRIYRHFAAVRKEVL